MFENLGLWLTRFTDGYVARVSADLSLALIPIALIWLTVYIVNYGYSVARNEVPEPLDMFAWKMLKVVFIFSIALIGANYMTIVFNTANGLQDGMATVFLSSEQYGQSAPATVFAALDAASERCDTIAAELWKQVGLTRLDLLFAAGVFMLGSAIFLIFGAYVCLLAKVVLTFALAIGPIAILCLMFKPTARFFESWLSLVLSAIVLSWFVFFALGFSFYAMDQTVQAVVASGAFQPGANPEGVSAVNAADGFLIMMVLLAILLYQAPQLASSLTGGSTVQLGMQMISNTLVGTRAAVGLAGAAAGRAAGLEAGGTLARGGGAAYEGGRAVGAAARSTVYAYQRVIARGRGR